MGLFITLQSLLLWTLGWFLAGAIAGVILYRKFKG